MTQRVKEAGKKEIRVFKDLEEIFKHNTKDSCWLMIDRKIYDVTGFDHPGKFQILLQNAGQDATTQFEDIGHSPKAFELMKDMQIGIYQPEDDDDLISSKMKGNA